MLLIEVRADPIGIGVAELLDQCDSRRINRSLALVPGTCRHVTTDKEIAHFFSQTRIPYVRKTCLLLIGAKVSYDGQSFDDRVIDARGHRQNAVPPDGQIDRGCGAGKALCAEGTVRVLGRRRGGIRLAQGRRWRVA